MSRVAKISTEQFKEIYMKPFAKSSFFAPRLDEQGNIIISEIEIDQMDFKLYPWKVDLELKKPEEILKTFETKEAELLYLKEEAEKEAQELSRKLEQIKKPTDENVKK